MERRMLHWGQLMAGLGCSSKGSDFFYTPGEFGLGECSHTAFSQKAQGVVTPESYCAKHRKALSSHLSTAWDPPVWSAGLECLPASFYASLFLRTALLTL